MEGFALISIFDIDNFDENDINFCDYFVFFFYVPPAVFLGYLI